MFDVYQGARTAGRSIYKFVVILLTGMILISAPAYAEFEDPSAPSSAGSTIVAINDNRSSAFQSRLDDPAKNYSASVGTIESTRTPYLLTAVPVVVASGTSGGTDQILNRSPELPHGPSSLGLLAIGLLFLILIRKRHWVLR